MSDYPDVVAFACIDANEDRCAPLIFDELQQLVTLTPLDVRVDGMPVLRHVAPTGRVVDVVRTARVLSHDFGRYGPIVHERWGGCRIGLLLNWHEGPGAPDRILPAHSTGDVPSGTFGPADPQAFQAVLRALEAARRDYDLHDFTVLPEATHWSGTQHGLFPSLLTQCGLPIIDVEVGSTPESWGNRLACRVVAKAALTALDYEIAAPVALFVGGVHFEPTCRAAAFARPEEVAFGHILPNQWVNGPHYESVAGTDKLRAGLRSIRGPVHGIAFHDKLRGPLKDAVRAAAAWAGIPPINHRRLREGELTASVAAVTTDAGSRSSSR